MTRRGVALVAVLWTVTLLGATVAAGTAATQLGQRLTGNRLALARGRWAAEACLGIAEGRAARNRLTDTATIDLGRTVTCTWTVGYPDARLDLNRAQQETLVALATGLGVPADSAELFGRLVMAASRARGAAGLSDVRQILSLPGASLRLSPYLTVDGSGRVDAARASQPVLSALPGITTEAAGLILRRREAGFPVSSLDELGGLLSPASRAALHAAYRDLAPLLAFGSGRRTLVVHGWVGSYGERPRATIEVVVEVVGDRLAVLRRRMS